MWYLVICFSNNSSNNLLVLKKLLQILHAPLGCVIEQSYWLLIYVYIWHDILVNISGCNLKYIVNCGNYIKYTYLSHLPNNTHILCDHHIYHHPTNMRQHHMQLCGHNIYHHSQNMKQYILQQIPLLYGVLHKIMARISGTLLSNISYKSWQQHLLDR